MGAEVTWVASISLDIDFGAASSDPEGVENIRQAGPGRLEGRS